MPALSLLIPELEGGGAQRVFVNLANELVDLSDDPVQIVTLRDGGVFRDELRPEVEVINLGTQRVSRSIPALVRYFRTTRPRVVCSTLNFCNVVTVVAWRLAGRPCRLVVREANVVREGRWFMRQLMRWTYPQADCVVALSPEIRANLLEAGIRVSHSVVEIGNPGVFESSSEPVAPPVFLPQPLPRFICAVGSLEEQKGFDLLLNAFARLSDPSLHLVILGEGSKRNALERQCEDLGIRERVHLPGFVKRPTEVVRQSALFVLPSRWEGFPNVLLEALSTGVPVVAADCAGAPRSMLEDGRHGHLVRPESAEALAEGIAQALESPIGTAESRRARAEDFAASKIARVYLEKAFLVEAKMPARKSR
ncbi:glycosyltransferase [Thioalkalivibrio sp. ALJ16]|uniref:glycosyltransferase n=1 Tax=Thioalkalivibrio sp. ALJ16 TaxID=1158762 RepID=UPI000372CB41|nr:glycosyltransferase [Thioalkalivibrio sp. ALJ16]